MVGLPVAEVPTEQEGSVMSLHALVAISLILKVLGQLVDLGRKIRPKAPQKRK